MSSSLSTTKDRLANTFKYINLDLIFIFLNGINVDLNCHTWCSQAQIEGIRLGQ